MISFKTTNLTYKIYRSDSLDVDAFLTADVLDYIFSNYLFYTGTESLDTG